MDKRKKVLLILACSFLLVGVLILLLVLLPSNNSNNKEDFSLKANDVYLSVGQISKINYTVTPSDLTPSFELEDCSIAKIVGTSIQGLSSGNTKLTISFIYNDEEYSTEITVYVKENYALNITPLQNCSVSDSVIYYSTNAQFSFSLTDYLNNPVTNVDCKIYCSEGIYYIKNLSTIILTSSIDGSITFEFPSLNYKATITLLYNK